MNERRIKNKFFKYIFCFVLVITLFGVRVTANAESKCFKPSEEWIYDSTEIMTADNPGESIEIDTEKIVCCNIGPYNDKQYYCDKYYRDADILDENEVSIEDNGNLSPDVCNPSKADSLDPDWEFLGCRTYYKGTDYLKSSPDKEIPGVEKVICGSEKGSEAGVGQKWYQCDIYQWTGEAQEVTGSVNEDGPKVPNCTNDSKWVYAYTHFYGNKDMTSTNENTKICCREGSVGTAGQFICDVYTTEDYKDNIIVPDPNDKEELKFNPTKLCEDSESCNIDLNSFCTEPTVARTFKFLGLLLSIAKIMVPAIIIIMGIVNLVHIITSGKEDEAKKAVKSIVTRIFIGVGIFLLPGIIVWVFETAYNISGSDKPSKMLNCAECILNPKECLVREE